MMHHDKVTFDSVVNGFAADLTFTTGVDHIQSGGAELGYGVKA